MRSWKKKFELELVSSRDKFHLKWKMKEISVSPPETLETLKTLKNSVSLSTLSVSKAEALLSQSQKLKLYSLGLKSWNSTLSVSTLSVSKAETLSVSTLLLSRSQLSLSLSLRRNFLSLAPVTTGNQVKKFLSHLPLLTLEILGLVWVSESWVLSFKTVSSDFTSPL